MQQVTKDNSFISIMNSSFLAPTSNPETSMNSLIGLCANGRRFQREASSASPFPEKDCTEQQDHHQEEEEADKEPSIKVVTKPKRPLTAYNIFFRDSQEQITAMNVPSNQKAKVNVAQLISDSWKKATPSVRVYYHELAAKDKFRYYNEKNEYKLYQSRIKNKKKKQQQKQVHKPEPTTSTTTGSSASPLAPLASVFMMAPQVHGKFALLDTAPPLPRQPQQPSSQHCNLKSMVAKQATTMHLKSCSTEGGPYCSKRAIADLAGRLDDASIDFLIRALK